MIKNGNKSYILSFTALFNAQKEYVLSVNCHQSLDVHTPYTFSAPISNRYGGLIMWDMKEGTKSRVEGSVLTLKEGEISFQEGEVPPILTSAGLLSYLATVNQSLQGSLLDIEATTTLDIKAEMKREIENASQLIAAQLAPILESKLQSDISFGVHLGTEGILERESTSFLQAIDYLGTVDNGYDVAVYQLPLHNSTFDEPMYADSTSMSAILEGSFNYEISEVIFNTLDSKDHIILSTLVGDGANEKGEYSDVLRHSLIDEFDTAGELKVQLLDSSLDSYETANPYTVMDGVQEKSERALPIQESELEESEKAITLQEVDLEIMEKAEGTSEAERLDKENLLFETFQESFDVFTFERVEMLVDSKTERLESSDAISNAEVSEVTDAFNTKEVEVENLSSGEVIKKGTTGNIEGAENLLNGDTTRLEHSQTMVSGEDNSLTNKADKIYDSYGLVEQSEQANSTHLYGDSNVVSENGEILPEIGIVRDTETSSPVDKEVHIDEFEQADLERILLSKNERLEVSEPTWRVGITEYNDHSQPVGEIGSVEDNEIANELRLFGEEEQLTNSNNVKNDDSVAPPIQLEEGKTFNISDKMQDSLIGTEVRKGGDNVHQNELIATYLDDLIAENPDVQSSLRLLEIMYGQTAVEQVKAEYTSLVNNFMQDVEKAQNIVGISSEEIPVMVGKVQQSNPPALEIELADKIGSYLNENTPLLAGELNRVIALDSTEIYETRQDGFSEDVILAETFVDKVFVAHTHLSELTGTYESYLFESDTGEKSASQDGVLEIISQSAGVSLDNYGIIHAPILGNTMNLGKYDEHTEGTFYAGGSSLEVSAEWGFNTNTTSVDELIFQGAFTLYGSGDGIHNQIESGNTFAFADYQDQNSSTANKSILIEEAFNLLPLTTGGKVEKLYEGAQEVLQKANNQEEILTGLVDESISSLKESLILEAVSDKVAGGVKLSAELEASVHETTLSSIVPTDFIGDIEYGDLATRQSTELEAVISYLEKGSHKDIFFDSVIEDYEHGLYTAGELDSIAEQFESATLRYLELDAVRKTNLTAELRSSYTDTVIEEPDFAVVNNEYDGITLGTQRAEVNHLFEGKLETADKAATNSEYEITLSLLESATVNLTYTGAVELPRQAVLHSVSLGALEDFDKATQEPSVLESVLAEFEHAVINDITQEAVEDMFIQANVNPATYLGILETPSVGESKLVSSFAEIEQFTSANISEVSYLGVVAEEELATFNNDDLLLAVLEELEEASVNVQLEGLADIEAQATRKKRRNRTRIVKSEDSKRKPKKLRTKVVKTEKAVGIGFNDNIPDEDPNDSNDVSEQKPMWLITGKPYAWNNKNWAKTR